MKDLPIQELMTRELSTVDVSTPLTEVVAAANERRLSCLVVMEGERPVGIITERDLVNTLAEVMGGAEFTQRTAAEIMSQPPITIHERATLFEALVVARSRNIRHLPVVDDAGRFVGLITQSNLVAAHFRLVDRQREALEQTVQERTAELAEANEMLKALSLTDTLLGIGNRRAMEVDLEHTLAEANRYGDPCSLALLDVDYFKRYNDHYGHQAGDEALRILVAYLRQHVRGADRLYRYGGEELLLLMPKADREQATQTVSRLVQGLAREAIPHEGSPLGKLTISAGVATQSAGDPNSVRSLLGCADRNLYQAKADGRNRMIAPDCSKAA